MRVSRRAIILPVVLVVISLLALTMAGFIFFVRAETAGTLAHGDLQQARLAAESGLEEIIATLRLNPHDTSVWFDSPGRFRHTLIWSEGYEREDDPVAQTGTRESLFEEYAVPPHAWRFSAVGDSFVEPSDAESRSMRFGITPEGSRLHLNVAEEEQIGRLLTPLLFDLQVENTEELINALLDWRDEDDETRDGGAESEYYNTLEPPYNAKNAPFDSVEELMLVKGFNAAVLYGEDTNRNGILDPNEDDGEESFPYYDNMDGVLNRGIAPFLTIWTREPDTALDNRARINLTQDTALVQAQIEDTFTEEELEICEGAVNYILQQKQQGFNFAQLGSPAELYQGIDALSEEERAGGGALANSPITLEELPYVMNRFSIRTAEQLQEGTPGLININTAPLRVLELIPGLTDETVTNLVEMRPQQDSTALRTTAWPMTSGAVDIATFHAMAPYITTKSYQFHVEVLGYADHVKVSRRYEWIVEMAGPLAQVRYWRDLSSLGFAWPIDDEEVAGEGVEMGNID
ncbi:MAG: hypothetical protein ABIG44_11045 [Planctomycetota bacterium]